VHSLDGQFILRVFNPHAEQVHVKVNADWVVLNHAHRKGLFEYISAMPIQTPCLLKVDNKNQL